MIILRIAVIADDLTGALDTGVQFRAWGMTVDVAPTLDKLLKIDKSADVVVVNTDSRSDTPKEAYSKVREAAQYLSEAEFFYKKIDSTLRGNIGAELDALMKYTEQSQAIMAPSFPQTKRTTITGHLLVDGEKLQDTEYALDTSDPDSFIPAIISRQTDRKTTHIPLGIIRKNQEILLSEFHKKLYDGYEVVVLDSEFEKDLLKAARLCREVKIISGSAGLASQLPVGLGFRTPLPTLTICGSTRTTSRRQIENLKNRLGATKFTLEVSTLEEGVYSLIRELERALSSGNDVILVTSETILSPIQPVKRNVEDLIVVKLAEITGNLLKKHKVSGIVMIGGATALAVCEKLGVESLRIIGEIQTGIPLVELSTGLRAVTKAGGFGGEDSLIEAVKHLRRMRV